MNTVMSPESCFDSIADIGKPLADILPPDTSFYIVGGIAAAALRHAETFIDPTGTVKATKASDISTRRPNGTQRDVDILVDAVLDPKTMLRARRATELVVGGRLEVSLFGFDNFAAHQHERHSFLSRRLKDEHGQRYHQMNAIRQPVPAESYEPWQLELPNGAIVPILHPVGAMLAYRSRSISGLRHKDQAKFYDMAYKILDIEDFRLDITEGMFTSWNQFSNAIAAVRHGRPPLPETLRPGTSRAELAAMRWQGRLLRMAESQPKLVDAAQGPLMQRLLSSVIRAA